MPGSSDNGSSSNGGNHSGHSPSQDDNMAPRDAHPDNASVPKPKRLACMICRKRKLKCDGIRPSCSTCSRLGHNCAYDEQRRKSGPKRGYVKALEERLSEKHPLPTFFFLFSIVSSIDFAYFSRCTGGSGRGRDGRGEGMRSR